MHRLSGLELGRQLRETDWCRRQCRAALAADEQRSQLGAESSSGDAVQDEVDGVVQARQLVVEMRHVTMTTPISCVGGASCVGVVEECNKIGRVRPSVRPLASTLRMVTRSVSPRFSIEGSFSSWIQKHKSRDSDHAHFGGRRVNCWLLVALMRKAIKSVVIRLSVCPFLSVLRT